MNIQDIKEWCINLEINGYEIRCDKDGFYVDVDQDVIIRDKRLKRFPFKFGSVHGNFDCANNMLTTLEGAPESVDGTFRASFNKLTNLNFFPKKVNKFIILSNNNLTSLVGLPEFDKTWFKVEADIIWCHDNPQIKNEDYYHLFDLGYDVENIKTLRDFDLEPIKRQWIIHNIVTS